MTDQFLSSITTVAMAIVGVAILAVLVSKNSQTAAVMSGAGSAFSQALGTALSPINNGGFTGLGGLSGGAGYPNMGF